MKDTVLITEGKTLLFVPKGSQESNAPPKTPAFFNPRARINRDMSLLAYGALADDYGGDLTYLDALCGLELYNYCVRELYAQRLSTNIQDNPTVIFLYRCILRFIS